MRAEKLQGNKSTGQLASQFKRVLFELEIPEFQAQGQNRPQSDTKRVPIQIPKRCNYFLINKFYIQKILTGLDHI